MYLTYTRHRVQDYARWRAAFDANVPMLEKAGMLSTQIVQVNDDPTDVVVINSWPAKKNWDDFIASHSKGDNASMAESKQKGGLIGEPEWWGGEVVG